LNALAALRAASGYLMKIAAGGSEPFRELQDKKGANFKGSGGASRRQWEK